MARQHKSVERKSESAAGEPAPTQAAGAANAAASADAWTRARTLAVDCAVLCNQRHCRQIKILDVRGISPVTDFFVIATGTSPRQMHTVMEDLREMAGAQGRRPLNSAQAEGESWMLIDLVDVVVHLFSPQGRLYYDLENLWGDARLVQWE